MPSLRSVTFLVIGLLASGLRADDDVYQAPEAFLAETFAEASAVPAPQLLWMTQDMRPAVKEILGHAYPALRIRYWREGARTAWILEEIGKVKPITTGLVVNAGKLERVKVLVYRESHGWEVKHPFFTDQFRGAALDENQRLTQNIDGISGATLSVNALTKLGRLALYLHSHVITAEIPPAP
jgi:hypothetical protein